MIVDSDIVWIGSKILGVVEGYFNLSADPEFNVRPWRSLDDQGDRRIAIRYRSSQPDKFRAWVEASHPSLSVASSPLSPFAVRVPAAEYRPFERAAAEPAVRQILSALSQRFGVPGRDLSLLGSAALGRLSPNDIDIGLAGRDVCMALRARQPFATGTTPSAGRLLSYYDTVDSAALELLVRRDAWRQVDVDGYRVDIIPRYSPAEPRPADTFQATTATASTYRMRITADADSLHYPAIYDCHSGGVLIAWSRILQGTLRTGDALTVVGIAGHVLRDGVLCPAVATCEAYRIVDLRIGT